MLAGPLPRPPARLNPASRILHPPLSRILLSMPRNQAVNLHVGCFALTVSKHHNALFAGDPQLACDERERLGVWLADGRYATRAVATRHTEVLPDGLYEYEAAKKPKTVRSKPAGIMAHHKRPAYSRILPPAMPLVRPRRPHSLWQRARGAADSGSSDLASSSSDATPSPPDASPRQQPEAAGEEGDDGVVAPKRRVCISPAPTARARDAPRPPNHYVPAG